MQHSRLVRALTKAGATVSQEVHPPVTHMWGQALSPREIEIQKKCQRWRAKGPHGSVDWRTSPDERGADLYVHFVVSRHPDTDVQRDANYDSHFTTIKETVSACCG